MAGVWVGSYLRAKVHVRGRHCTCGRLVCASLDPLLAGCWRSTIMSGARGKSGILLDGLIDGFMGPGNATNLTAYATHCCRINEMYFFQRLIRSAAAWLSLGLGAETQTISHVRRTTARMEPT